MEYRSLGGTGLQVSRLGLGLAALGRPGYINLGHAEDLDEEYAVAEMEARAHAVLDAAWEHGVRYFDAARSYGKAEAFLSSWICERGLKPGDLRVGSKWGYTYTAGWQTDAEVHEVKEHSLNVLQRQWGESQALLGGHLNLYQIHSATLESGVLENQGVLAELARLKEEAGAFIGLTVSGEKQAEVIARALTVQVDGVRLFDTVQATWNLLERSTGSVLQKASRAGLGVIVKEALANGRLTARNDMPGFSGEMALLQGEAERQETSIDALALAAVLAQPWADVVLSGAATTDHLLSNLGAMDVRWDERADSVLAALEESPEQYWQIRSQLAWN